MILAAGDAIKLDSKTEIRGNLASFSDSIVMSATVAKDMLVAAERVVVSGDIGGSLNAATKHISLLDDAMVGGDIIYRTSTEDRLMLGDDVIIGGEVEYQGQPENFQARNRFISDSFYLWELLWFVGAFVVGWLLSLPLPPVLAGWRLATAKKALRRLESAFSCSSPYRLWPSLSPSPSLACLYHS